MKKRPLVLMMDAKTEARWTAFAAVAGFANAKDFAFYAVNNYVARNAPKGEKQTEYERKYAETREALSR